MKSKFKFLSLKNILLILVVIVCVALWRRTQEAKKKEIGPSIYKHGLHMLENRPKCQTPNERLLCSALDTSPEAPFGAIKKGNMLLVLLNGQKYFEAGKEVYEGKDQQELWYYAAFQFLKNSLSDEDFSQVDAKLISFEFYSPQNEGYDLQARFGLTPQKLDLLQDSILREDVGPDAVNELKKAFMVYVKNDKASRRKDVPRSNP